MATAKLVSKRPQAGSQKLWEFPPFTRTRLDSGLQIVAAHAPGRALGAARLMVEAGEMNEPEDLSGVANLAAQALTEGTDHYKGPAFINAVERLGADIDAGTDWDSFIVNLRAPINRMEPALELFAEAVRNPSFPGGEVERLRQERLGVIFQQYANPTTRATIAFNRMVYTPASPYHRPESGEFWSVYRLGKGRVRKYYQQFATPGSATLVIVGDIEGTPVVKLAEKLFGDWKGKEPDRPRPQVQNALTKTSVILVHREESEQSQVDLGHIGVPRSTPDYFPLTVALTALGGTAIARLMLRLREDKGYTYGISAGIDYRREAGPFRARTLVNTPVTVDAIAEEIEVMSEFKEKGLTKQELEEVKSYLIGVFPLRYETPESIASGLSTMVTHGLPENYFETYRTNIENVTLEDANRAAAEFLHPDRLAIVVVGDAEQVEDPLVKAGFGPVAVLEDPEPGNAPAH